MSASRPDHLAGRVYPRVYAVQGRQDLHQFVLDAVTASGGHVMYASSPRCAPVYLGVRTSRGDRLGMLVYPFRMNRVRTLNRPSDEVRGQLRYGGEESWAAEHPLGRDLAGIDITLVLGIDVAAQVFIGLQPALYDPLPMGISFYAKAEQLDVASDNGWHVWEKENRAGPRRALPRARSGLETVVAFTPDRLLDYALFERDATDLELDQPLRFVAARNAATASARSVPSNLHSLEEMFSLDSRALMDIISSRTRLQVAVRGGVAEHHLEQILNDDPAVISVSRLDQDALHDFNVLSRDGRDLRIECKNASPEGYANGDSKVETQKTRASLGDPASRFYRFSQFDVIAACMYSRTDRWEFRYRRTLDLTPHAGFPDRLAAIQHISPEWSTSLAALTWPA